MPNYRIDEVVDALAVISEVIFNRWKCCECNACYPGGDTFMSALEVLRSAGSGAARGGAAGGEQQR
jgi:hypothetical protein